MLGIGLVDWSGIDSLWLTLLPAVSLALAACVALLVHRRSMAMGLAGLSLIWMGATLHLWQQPPDTDDLGRVAGRDYQPLVFRLK